MCIDEENQDDMLTNLKTQHLMELMAVMRSANDANVAQDNTECLQQCNTVFGLYCVNNKVFITYMKPPGFVNVCNGHTVDQFVRETSAVQYNQMWNKMQPPAKFIMYAFLYLNMFNAVYFKVLMSFPKYLMWYENRSACASVTKPPLW